MNHILSLQTLSSVNDRPKEIGSMLSILCEIEV